MLLWIGAAASLVCIVFGSKAKIYFCGTLSGLARAGAYLRLSMWGMHVLLSAAIRRDENGRLYCVLQNEKKKSKNPRKNTRFTKGLPKRLLSMAQLDSVRLCIWEGCGEAAATAVLSGFLQSVLGAASGFVSRRYPKAALRYEVIPCYREACFGMHIYGIAHMHVGHAIVAVVRAAFAASKGG